MQNVEQNGDLLSVTQVAEELGKPARTVHYWITTGKIAATKLGPGTSQYVITRSEVERVKAAA